MSKESAVLSQIDTVELEIATARLRLELTEKHLKRLKEMIVEAEELKKLDKSSS